MYYALRMSAPFVDPEGCSLTSHFLDLCASGNACVTSKHANGGALSCLTEYLGLWEPVDRTHIPPRRRKRKTIERKMSPLKSSFVAQIIDRLFTLGANTNKPIRYLPRIDTYAYSRVTLWEHSKERARPKDWYLPIHA